MILTLGEKLFFPNQFYSNTTEVWSVPIQEAGHADLPIQSVLLVN